MSTYNFTYVGDIEDDPLGVWEKTAVGAGSIQGDGVYADVSSSGAAAWFWQHTLCTTSVHSVQLTWGSGAVRNQNGLVINVLDANDHIWAGCQTFSTWKVREYLAGAVTDIAVLSASNPNENEYHKLERLNASTVKFDINGAVTTSIASTLYNTKPRRGLKVNNNTNLNIWKSFTASDDYSEASPGTAKLKARGYQASIVGEVFSNPSAGSLKTRGSVVVLGGTIFETLDMLAGSAKFRGNIQTIEEIGSVQGISAGVGSVKTRGNQHVVDFMYTADLAPTTGSNTIFGYEHEISGRLFIDAVPGSVTVRGSSGLDAGEVSVVDVNTGKIKIRGSTNTVLDGIWIPDTTQSNSWARLIGDGDS